jgi:uncharacterized membrane protein HdeD (DUF308 family)
MAPSESTLRRSAAAVRGFTMFEGVLFLVLGFLALSFPLVASKWVTAMVALAFLVAGLVGLITILNRARFLRGAVTFWRLVLAVLFTITGFWMVKQLAAGPLSAGAQVAALALAIGVVFLVEGVVETILALSHRQVPGWGWGLSNGLITLILGLLILTMKFWNLLWVLGVLVGISFLFSGIDLLSFSARFHPEEQ